ncbi:MAG: hypothetical protein AB4290_30995 [Spirulina sp.]
MECPVCQTKYVKGKVQRCHVCGWELSPSCLSMVGPLRVEHQISMSSLEKIQAWAHYMWSTQQSQKEQVAKLQRQLKKAQQEEERTRMQLEQSRSQQRLAPHSPPVSPPQPNASPPSTVPVDRLPAEGREVWEWLLQRFARAEEERSQLQLQLAQLQGTPHDGSRAIAREGEKRRSGEEENNSAFILQPSPLQEKSHPILPSEQMRDLELLRMELQSRAALQLSQFQAVEQLKEQFQQQIETVTQQIQKVSEERDRLHSQLSEQQTRLECQQQEWEAVQNVLTKRCDFLESQLKDQQTHIQQLKSEYCDRWESQLKDQQTHIQQLSDRLVSQLNDQQTQIQQLQEDSTEWQTAIAQRDRLLDEKEREQRERMENYIEEINRERKERDRQQSHLAEQLRHLRQSWQSHLTQQQTTWQLRQQEGEELQSEWVCRQT